MIKRYLFALTLILCMGVFSFQTFASTGGEELLFAISAAWVQGETLHIEITNTQTGDNQSIELDIKDLAEDREIITIQAVDFDGNQSNIIQIKNPYYKPSSDSQEEAASEKTESDGDDEKSGLNPLTPDGSGSVVDNATGNDEKEFFTIQTDNGNTFYLIVDRQRNSDNVYLLDAVTERDLLALAEKSGNSGGIEIPEPQTPEPTPKPQPTEPEPIEEEQTKGKKPKGNGSIFIVLFITVAVGGVGYYLKIYKPKLEENNIDSDFDDEDEFDDEDYFLDDELGDFEDTDFFTEEETEPKEGGDEE